MTTIEEWRAIAGFEGLYEVSSFGRVRTVDKMQRYLLRNKQEAFRFIPSHLIATSLSNKGYVLVKLYKLNRLYTKTVHSLVAKAFVPMFDPTLESVLEVDHKDRDRQNNRFSNLDWILHVDNIRRSFRWQK